MVNSATRKIVIGFLIIILMGAILLSMPFSARSGQVTPFLNCVFTATSATCVTGLVTYDTFTHWSPAGQVILLLLIQIGGIGFMTVITMFSLFLKKQISLHERRILMQSAGTLQIGGIVRLVRRILLGTMFFEGVGAIILAMRFCPMMGIGQGLWNAVFHSVSAFCNAGFDLMGKYDSFSSLTYFKGDILVNVTIMALIVVGGIGFIVWNDIYKWKLKFKKYELHTKMVLLITVFLIIVPAILFLIFEWSGELKECSISEKIVAAFFQSVTLRTAGFNTINQANLSESGNILSVILMFIGGSPGSTAGGIKTTTIAVLLLSALASARQSESITIFKKRIGNDTVRQAAGVFGIYLLTVIIASMIICHIEEFLAEDIIFEVVSAMGTVGISKGITTLLCPLSKIILIILMFGGRVGGITLMLAVAHIKQDALISRPYGKILIG